MLKLGEFVHYKTKTALELLGVWEQTSNVSGRFRWSLFWISWKLTQCVTPVRCWEFTKCPRSTIESISNQGQCLKLLEIFKEAFYVFRKIKSENSWKWNKFKIVMYLKKKNNTFPGYLNTATKHFLAFFPDFSYLFSDSDHFFRDPWVPLTFFPASTLVVYHIPIKIREKNNVLTQHSVNAHTKPLSEKQSLSESCGRSYQT